jgi:hypothetical protein
MFAHLEKTAGTFIEEFLNTTVQHTGHCNIRRPKEMGYEIDASRHKRYENPNIQTTTCRHDALWRFIPTNKSVHKFGYIRNPYDWYLSLWSFSRKGHSTYSHMFKEFGSDLDINIFIKSMFDSTYSLCYYGNSLLGEGEKYELPHIDFSLINKLDIGLLTYRYLYIYYHPSVFKDIENYKDYNLGASVLRFERLIGDIDDFFLNKLLYKLSRKQMSWLLNSGPRRKSNHRHYTENYYTNEVIELIKHKDRIIFDEYEYTF